MEAIGVAQESLAKELNIVKSSAWAVDDGDERLSTFRDRKSTLLMSEVRLDRLNLVLGRVRAGRVDTLDDFLSLLTDDVD
jgi:hypothetical protein